MDIALHEPTCRVRRHAHVQHLLVADETSLAELETALAVLPICATGRVFIEVPDASWIGVVEAPGRMVVTWLDRFARAQAAQCRPGDALARAVTAWADEMLCGGDGDAVEGDGETRVLLLGAGHATERIVTYLTGRWDVEPAAIRIPAPIR